MNPSNQYLVSRHHACMKHLAQWRLSGMIIQFSMITEALSLKNILGPYKALAPILLCCGIYFWAQDSFKTLQLHRRRFDLLLEGLSVEKASPSYGTFFKQAVQAFRLKKIILQLSIAGILSLGAFGYCLFEFLKEYSGPNFSDHYRTLADKKRANRAALTKRTILAHPMLKRTAPSA